MLQAIHEMVKQKKDKEGKEQLFRPYVKGEKNMEQVKQKRYVKRKKQNRSRKSNQ